MLHSSFFVKKEYLCKVLQLYGFMNPKSNKSRTSLGIRNGRVAFVYILASIVIGFVSRKVFLEYLGTDILGLNSTAENLLGILNLSELGIGAAVAYMLYKPLQQNDHQTIDEIVTLQGWLYQRIAYVVGLGAILFMAFFPLIFAHIEIPLGYAYASFGVFLYSSLLTYFTNYKQILLSASQQQYQVIYNYQSILLVKSLVQIVALIWLPYPYISWLVLQVIFATGASWQLHRAVRRLFPFLSLHKREGKHLIHRYPHLITKVKQVFFHHLASFALSQSSPLLIFAFTNLTTVALYGNYQLLVLTLQKVNNSFFTGIQSGIGHLVAEGNSQRIFQVFKELFSLRFLLAGICCYCLLELLEPFIQLWIGANYLLHPSTLYLICGILYINLSRQAVETYLAAHGMYQDIAAPIIEAALNIGLSCWFGYLWGIDGILIGVLTSLIIVVLGWKPYFLFRYGLKQKFSDYHRMYAVHLLCLGIAYYTIQLLQKVIPFPTIDSYGSFCVAGLLHFSIFSLLLGTFLGLCTSGMKGIFKRLFQPRHL